MGGNLPDNKGTWKLFIKIDGEEPEWFIVCVSHMIRKTGDVENFVVGRYPTKSLACQAVSNVDPMVSFFTKSCRFVSLFSLKLLKKFLLRKMFAFFFILF